MTEFRDRVVYYYSLTLRDKNNGTEKLCDELSDVLNWTSSLEYKLKCFQKESSKKNHLIYLEFVYPKNRNNIQHGKVASLKPTPRPDVVRRGIGVRNGNPRNKDDDEAEDVHFSIIYKKDATIIAIENNVRAFSPESLIVYFKRYYEKYCTINKLPNAYNIQYVKLACGNFNSIIEELKRVSCIQISANSNIFGSAFGGYSGRLPTTTKNIELTIKPDRNESLQGVAEDVYQYYSSDKTQIEKITILGEDGNGSRIKLDSLNIHKDSNISVELDDKLTVRSPCIFKKMETLLLEL